MTIVVLILLGWPGTWVEYVHMSPTVHFGSGMRGSCATPRTLPARTKASTTKIGHLFIFASLHPVLRRYKKYATLSLGIDCGTNCESRESARKTSPSRYRGLPFTTCVTRTP